MALSFAIDDKGILPDRMIAALAELATLVLIWPVLALLLVLLKAWSAAETRSVSTPSSRAESGFCTVARTARPKRVRLSSR